MTIGIVVLAGSRMVGPLRRSSDGAEPLAVPWLMPAAVAATLFGFAIHASTVEVARGVALLPTTDGFAQGFLIGCFVAAAVMLAPFDLAQAASRARSPTSVRT